MSRMHEKIDGTDDTEVVKEDEPYAGTKHYWARGWLGMAYQTFLDANTVIDNCDLTEMEKNQEKAKIVESRKTALGTSFAHFPPWSSR